MPSFLDNPLVQSFIKEVIIPEAVLAARAIHAATGRYATDAEVRAALIAEGDKGIQVGEAWLAAHPEPK